MKEKILMFIIGFLVGAIITAGGFLIFSRTNNNNIQTNGQMEKNMSQMMQKERDNQDTPPEMPQSDNQETRPELPSENNQRDMKQMQSSERIQGGQKGQMQNSSSKTNQSST